MATDFERFTQAVQQRSAAKQVRDSSPSFSNATVLGGGADGRMLAGLLLANGLSVTLFSAYGAEMNALHSAGGITLRGDGPAGTYQIDQSDSPSILTTAELDVAVASSDLIFLTGPVHKQRTYAMVLADHLVDGQTLVVAPARTFAAVEMNWLLHVGGCRADCTVVELQNLSYWPETTGNILHLSSCGNTTAAALPGQRSDRVQAMQAIFQNMTVAPSVIHSGFADAGGAVECVALLLGGSLVHRSTEKLPDGAQPLEERQTLFSLIDNDRSHELLVTLLRERRDVARQFGVRNLPEISDWIVNFSGSIAGSGSRKIPSPELAVDMVHCAVTGSLVPLQSAGRLTGVATPVTDSIVSLASASLGRNLETAGRKLDAMGISAGSTDDARRQLESIVRGER